MRNISAYLIFISTPKVSLGPLMFASTFVLVGDHYQLPPLVQVYIMPSHLDYLFFLFLSTMHFLKSSSFLSRVQRLEKMDWG